ncbi:MAG: EAL domain-containing protein [Proteobacteria bacterium]|nr:EAL domain-containing protein [Pseudomonadota bacterium]
MTQEAAPMDAKAAPQLQAADERFHLVARATAEAIWDWDLQTGAMWWSEGMETLFGVPMDSLPPDSSSWTLRLHPQDAAQVEQSLRQAVEGTAEFWGAQYRFRRQDGSYAWVEDRGFVLRDADGRGLRMVGGMTDISARKLAELQYRALFADHPQPMWVCDQDSLLLLAANHAMARHYGYQADELLGMDMRLLWPVQERAMADSAMAMCRDARAAQPTPMAATTWRHAHKNGTPMEMEVYVGVTEFDGRPAWQILAHDITERNRIEAELTRLSRAQRMRSACNENLLRASTEPELLHAICEIAVQIGGYRMGWVGLARHDARKRIDPVAHAGGSSDYLERLQLSWSPMEPGGQGPASICVRSARTVVIRDIQNNPLFRDKAEYLHTQGFHTAVYLPLHHLNASLGLLCLYAPEVLELGAQETQLLEAMAADLAFGIQNLRLRAEQQRLQTAMVKVATAVSAGTGETFFERLAQHMADALSAQVACVVRLQPPVDGRHLHATTLSHIRDGIAQPAHEYALAGTPSARLLSQDRLLIEDRVSELFPGDTVLAQCNVRSFVGQQLAGSDGRPLGMIMVMYRERLQQVQLVDTGLQIFAARAAAEMQRQVDDTRIRQQASLLNKASDAIIVHDLDYRITFWNERAERLYGWNREEALGRSAASLLHNDPQYFHEACEQVLRMGEWTGELQQFARDGRSLEVEGRWTLVRNDQGETESILAINSDIGERKASEREIQRLAFFDALTGLPNRVHFMQRMNQALALAQRQGRGGALLFIDLDNFKILNDTLGHDQGDLLLKSVAQRLNTCVRAMDTVARLGGDEFVVLLELIGAQGDILAEHAHKVGEKILNALSIPYALAGHQYRSTPSIGITLFDASTSSVSELLKQADLAMYQSKTAGRSTLRFFDPSMQKTVDEHVALEASLRAGLSQQEFSLHYQPQFSAQGQVLGVEALLRWTHPTRGMVSPAEFIPAAEETGLILPLGRWVLHNACSQLAAWQKKPALAPLSMAVNVSSRQFRDAGFVADVLRVLAVTGAPAARLKLELTESLLVEDMASTIATMEALRAHGIGFSLDDFGTGYSSLTYLKRMPLGQLKIDQSFVRDLLTDPNDAAIVRTIIALANSLGLTAIAEGVETVEQRKWLAQAGCHAYQGYLFGKPRPAEDIEQQIQAYVEAGNGASSASADGYSI